MPRRAWAYVHSLFHIKPIEVKFKFVSPQGVSEGNPHLVEYAFAGAYLVKAEGSPIPMQPQGTLRWLPTKPQPTITLVGYGPYGRRAELVLTVDVLTASPIGFVPKLEISRRVRMRLQLAKSRELQRKLNVSLATSQQFGARLDTIKTWRLPLFGSPSLQHSQLQLSIDRLVFNSQIQQLHLVAADLTAVKDVTHLNLNTHLSTQTLVIQDSSPDFHISPTLKLALSWQ